MKALFDTAIGTAKGVYRKTIKLLAESNYYSARVFYKRQLRLSSLQHDKPPLLIHQMGKVGSSTVHKSLSALRLSMPIYHVHYLCKDRVANLEKDRKKYFKSDKYHLLKRPWLYQYLHKQLEHLSSDNKWKVITLTREPIARNISSFFENLEVRSVESGNEYEIKSDYYSINPFIVNTEELDELTELFFDRLDHDSPISFFDREINGVYGIDVYASEFPVSKGFKIYEGKKADLLVLRLESIDSCVSEAMNEFLGIEKFGLKAANIGADKVYASLYRKMKESIIFSDQFIDNIYNSIYMRHFYSECEIKEFRARWLAGDSQKTER